MVVCMVHVHHTYHHAMQSQAHQLDTYPIDGLVIAWHGGMYGARALLDCLTGLISPSAKLPMTIVKDIKDIPSHEQFGLEKRTFYIEDIYVGYRYFETFNKNAVRYPFGYGLTYKIGRAHV